MNNDRISVIVPVYKAEPYLRRCVDSILEQTYTNLEVILVDDGSPDGCPAICDEYKRKDSRVRVIHKENRGLSSARNAGMEIARGEYLTFVDSDDYIEPDMYQDLMEACRQNNADIATCNYQYGKWRAKDTGETYVYDGKTAVMKMFTQRREGDGISVAPVDKLYKRSVFEEITFNESLFFAEDIECIGRVVYLAQSVCKIDKTYYCYCQDGESLMRSPFSAKKALGVVGAYESLEKFYREKDQELFRLFYRMYVDALLNQIFCCKNAQIDSSIENCMKCLVDKLKIRDRKLDSSLRKNTRVKLLAFGISPKLFLLLEMIRKNKG